MYLLCYDIKDNQLRKKISDKIIYFGLDRIQYSVYLGKISTSDLQTLLTEMRQLVASSNYKYRWYIVRLTGQQVKEAINEGTIDTVDTPVILGEKLFDFALNGKNTNT